MKHPIQILMGNPISDSQYLYLVYLYIDIFYLVFHVLWSLSQEFEIYLCNDILSCTGYWCLEYCVGLVWCYIIYTDNKNLFHTLPISSIILTFYSLKSDSISIMRYSSPGRVLFMRTWISLIRLIIKKESEIVHPDFFWFFLFLRIKS